MKKKSITELAKETYNSKKYKTNAKEIKKVFKVLPKPNKVILVEADKEVLKERLEKRMYPFQECGKEKAKAVMEVCFINYPLFKELIVKELEVNIR